MPNPETNPQATYMGTPRIDLERVDSTNRFAWEMMGHATEGTLVNAYEQFAGRGQRSNSWDAAPGLNLTLSVVLRPAFVGVHNIFMLNKVVSLAVAGLLTEHLPANAVRIKWPNDVLVHDQKVAGLLIENQVGNAGGQARVEATVAGIGLNVNQTVFAPALRGRVTSLALATGNTFLLDPLIQSLMYRLEREYERLRAGAAEAIDRAYLARLYRYQEWAQYQSGQTLFRGMIVGVLHDGKLALQHDAQDGINRSPLAYYNFKEVAFV